MVLPAAAHVPSRLESGAARVAAVSGALMVLVPLGVVGYWLMVDAETLAAQWLAAGFPGPVTIDAARRIAGLALVLATLAPLIVGLGALRRLFRLYARGELFGPANAATLRRFGKAIVWTAIAQTLVVPLMGLLLTFDNPPGQRALTFGLEFSTIIIALVGVAIVLIAAVMDEARRLSEDQALTV